MRPSVACIFPNYFNSTINPTVYKLSDVKIVTKQVYIVFHALFHFIYTITRVYIASCIMFMQCQAASGYKFCMKLRHTVTCHLHQWATGASSSLGPSQQWSWGTQVTTAPAHRGNRPPWPTQPLPDGIPKIFASISSWFFCLKGRMDLGWPWIPCFSQLFAVMYSDQNTQPIL